MEVIMANHRSSCRRSFDIKPGSDSPSEDVSCTAWDIFALLLFVLASYGGLLFCAYIIMAKCRVTSSF